MNNERHVKATLNLIRDIQRAGLTLKPEALEPTEFHKNKTHPTPSLIDIDPIEKTNIYHLFPYFIDTRFDWWDQESIPQEPAEWCAITTNPDNSVLEFYDHVTCTTSMSLALTSLLYQMKQNRITPTSATKTEAGFTVANKNGVFVSVERIQFEAINRTNYRRALNAMKGVYINTDDGRLDKMLRKIYGLQKYTFGFDCFHFDRQTSLKLLNPTSSNFCSSFQLYLNSIIQEFVPKHLAQDLMSHYLGHQSWNHLKATDDKVIQLNQMPIMIYRDRKPYTGPVRNEHPEFGDIELDRRMHDPEGIDVLAYCHDYPHAFSILSNYLSSAPADNEIKIADMYSGLSRYHVMAPDSLNIMQVYEEPVADNSDLQHDASLMLTAPSFETALKQYFYADLPRREQLLAINARDGYPLEDHLFIEDWVFWVQREGRLSEMMVIEPIDPYQSAHTAYMHPIPKLRFVEAEPGRFYLGRDYEHNLREYIPCLNMERAKLVVDRLMGGDWARYIRPHESNKRSFFEECRKIYQANKPLTRTIQ